MEKQMKPTKIYLLRHGQSEANANAIFAGCDEYPLTSLGVLQAECVAKYLKNNEKVAWVSYPDLEGDKYYDLAKKYLPNGSCGVVSFGVKGGRAAAEKLMKNLKIAAIETHVADARTCCLHPASATHRQMNEEELIAAGVPGDLIRYSCGIENAEDLIADLQQAFDKID